MIREPAVSCCSSQTHPICSVIVSLAQIRDPGDSRKLQIGFQIFECKHKLDKDSLPPRLDAAFFQSNIQVSSLLYQ